MELPNLAGKATEDLVQKIGAGSYSAAYINWARTMQLLREHAPGWMPELVKTASGDVLHTAPAGAFLLIRFRHVDGTLTPDVPQAVMDDRNKAIPVEKITARDITDTHRRGVCMAAAFTFGLAYELWAKMPLESGYAERDGEGDSVDTNADWLTAISDAADLDSLKAVKGQMRATFGAQVPKSLIDAYNARIAAFAQPQAA